jgi:hypothetical protein
VSNVSSVDTAASSSDATGRGLFSSNGAGAVDGEHAPATTAPEQSAKRPLIDAPCHELQTTTPESEQGRPETARVGATERKDPVKTPLNSCNTVADCLG